MENKAVYGSSIGVGGDAGNIRRGFAAGISFLASETTTSLRTETTLITVTHICLPTFACPHFLLSQHLHF